MEKFLIETECANLNDHHIFWCSKCNANKVDSLEQKTGRFFCISGNEFRGDIGDPKTVVFALCPNCLATDMWAEYSEETPKAPEVTLPYTWLAVKFSPYFISAFARRDLVSCINMTATLMHTSLEDAKELVIDLLDEFNNNNRAAFVSSLNLSS